MIGVFDLFSKRQSALRNDIPNKVRLQIINTLREWATSPNQREKPSLDILSLNITK